MSIEIWRTHSSWRCSNTFFKSDVPVSGMILEWYLACTKDWIQHFCVLFFFLSRWCRTSPLSPSNLEALPAWFCVLPNQLLTCNTRTRKSRREGSYERKESIFPKNAFRKHSNIVAVLQHNNRYHEKQTPVAQKRHCSCLMFIISRTWYILVIVPYS